VGDEYRERRRETDQVQVERGFPVQGCCSFTDAFAGAVGRPPRLTYRSDHDPTSTAV
jgi:hypothetical protein